MRLLKFNDSAIFVGTKMVSLVRNITKHNAANLSNLQDIGFSFSSNKNALCEFVFVFSWSLCANYN